MRPAWVGLGLFAAQVDIWCGWLLFARNSRDQRLHDINECSVGGRQLLQVSIEAVKYHLYWVVRLHQGVVIVTVQVGAWGTLRKPERNAEGGTLRFSPACPLCTHEFKVWRTGRGYATASQGSDASRRVSVGLVFAV